MLVSNFAASNAIGVADYIGTGYNLLTSNFDYEDSSLLQNNLRVLAPNVDQISVAQLSSGSTCSAASQTAPSHLFVFEGTLAYQSKIRERVTISGSD